MTGLPESQQCCWGGCPLFGVEAVVPGGGWGSPDGREGWRDPLPKTREDREDEEGPVDDVVVDEEDEEGVDVGGNRDATFKGPPDVPPLVMIEEGDDEEDESWWWWFLSLGEVDDEEEELDWEVTAVGIKEEVFPPPGDEEDEVLGIINSYIDEY